jgi:Mn-dependent DtxR family transcriptional regulator
MSVNQNTMLSTDDLNTTDRRIIDELQEGRVTPAYLRNELEVSREYASERLTRFREHGIVVRLAAGLYELTETGEEWIDHTVEEGQTDE